jgi:putative tryptophan/tyrosine transport system substrate-binding protein
MLGEGFDLFVTGGPGALALRGANATQPIVAFMGDPVAQGLAASYARPGANVTVLSVSSPGLETKRLELLKKTVPNVACIAAVGATPALGSANELSAAAQALARIIHRGSGASGERPPERFARMKGTEMEAEAGNEAPTLFADPAGDLEQAQAQRVELIPRAGGGDEATPERVERNIGSGVEQ